MLDVAQAENFEEQHRDRVSRRFSRAASSYDQVASIQREIGLALIEAISKKNIPARNILDIGAGTGWVSEKLFHQYPQADYCCLDIAFEMTKQLKQKSKAWQVFCGDAENLPMPSHFCELVFSNLMLQWSLDLNALFQEWGRVLQPHGFVAVSFFDEKTLGNIRGVWGNYYPKANFHPLPTIEKVREAVERQGFSIQYEKRFSRTVSYPTLFSLLKSIKQLGANGLANASPNGLYGRAYLQQAMESLGEGSLSSTFSGAFLIAQKVKE